jgi:phospholipase C
MPTTGTADVNGGKMDGFIARAERGRRGCLDPDNPACTNTARPDVMGYHDGGDIPNYWKPARASLRGLGMVGFLH